MTARRPQEQAQTLVVSVLFLTVLLGFAGLLMDGGTYLVQRRNMQGTADAAALAAVRELPGNQANAASVAHDYAEQKNSADGGTAQTVSFGDVGSSVTVTVGTTGRSSFGKLLGIDAPPISAKATARVQMMGPRAGMLPLAFMRDSFTVGVNYDVKFGKSATGNRGAIAPGMMPSCGAARGASDFGQLIRSSAYGGTDACATPIANTVDTEPGNMTGPTRSAFSDRLGTNMDSFEQTFEQDPSTGLYTILKPNSPRIGIIPVVENSDGSTTWPNGRSSPVRILAYMMVYIGDRSSPPDYPATHDGKAVWVTPVQALLPPDFQDGTLVNYTAGLPAPLVYHLTD